MQQFDRQARDATQRDVTLYPTPSHTHLRPPHSLSQFLYLSSNNAHTNTVQTQKQASFNLATYGEWPTDPVS